MSPASTQDSQWPAAASRSPSSSAHVSASVKKQTSAVETSKRARAASTTSPSVAASRPSSGTRKRGPSNATSPSASRSSVEVAVDGEAGDRPARLAQDEAHVGRDLDQLRRRAAVDDRAELDRLEPVVGDVDAEVQRESVWRGARFDDALHVTPTADAAVRPFAEAAPATFRSSSDASSLVERLQRRPAAGAVAQVRAHGQEVVRRRLAVDDRRQHRGDAPRTPRRTRSRAKRARKRARPARQRAVDLRVRPAAALARSPRRTSPPARSSIARASSGLAGAAAPPPPAPRARATPRAPPRRRTSDGRPLVPLDRLRRSARAGARRGCASPRACRPSAATPPTVASSSRSTRPR